jgi:hypothetical protein
VLAACDFESIFDIEVVLGLAVFASAKRATARPMRVGVAGQADHRLNCRNLNASMAVAHCAVACLLRGVIQRLHRIAMTPRRMIFNPYHERVTGMTCRLYG